MNDQSTITVMNWNFLEGGCRRLPLDAGPVEDVSRVHAAQKLIEKLNPDVLVINEALWSKGFQGHVRDYAKIFGFNYSSTHLYDKNWGNALLSRFPITDMVELKIYNRAGFVANIETSGGLIQVGTYHPHPSRFPHNKRKDFRRILSLFDENLPGVFAGDFNMISPDDEPNIDMLELGFSRFSKTPREDAQRFIDAGLSVVPVLESMGWRDVMNQAKRPTIPTKMLSKDGILDNSAMRIDHMWANDKCRVLHSRVMDDPLADIASDHYPLLATVGLLQ